MYLNLFILPVIGANISLTMVSRDEISPPDLNYQTYVLWLEDLANIKMNLTQLNWT